MQNEKISTHPKKIFYELGFLAEDQELVRAIRDCIEAQRKASRETLKTVFQPNPQALKDVSPEALEEILASGQNVNGIRTEGEISNVIVFNDKRYENAVFGEEITAARKRVDELIAQKVLDLFEEGSRMDLVSSGFFLYPPQAYMGWHTNWQNPGWRLYINYAEEPGKSFFRYRDPVTHQIVTSVDKQVNFRLFKATAKSPFWHAVYSDTFRYSLGYKISKRQSRLIHQFRKHLFGPIKALLSK